MKIKSLIQKIKDNTYYHEWKRLTDMDAKEYHKSFVSKQTNSCSVYDNRRRSCNRYIPSFSLVENIFVGMYEFKYTLYVGLPKYYYDKEIVSEINIVCKDLNACGEYFNIKLNGNECVSNVKQIVFKHLSQYFHSDGALMSIQYLNRLDKQQTYTYLKTFIRNKYFLSEAPLSEDVFRKWVLRKFNILSNVSIRDTLKIVNSIGKQKETFTIYGTDISFMLDYEDDIDGLESAYFKYNPIKPNTIYI